LVKPGDLLSPGWGKWRGFVMKDQSHPWESVFAGPEVTAVPGDTARFEEKPQESSDQGRFED
jgi:hypothetical protein